MIHVAGKVVVNICYGLRILRTAALWLYSEWNFELLHIADLQVQFLPLLALLFAHVCT